MVDKSILDLANEAADFEDQTEDHGGGDFEYKPPAAGVTIGRFIEYIELGKAKRPPFKGKPKPDAERVRLTFELLSPNKNKVTYKDAEGNEVVTYETISSEVSKILTDRAKYRKIMKAMMYGRPEIKHMAQMLGNAFIIDITHNTVPAANGQPEKTFANMWDKDNNIGIRAPRMTDPITSVVTEIPVPPATKPLRLFLFERPTKATWDSLFIDGTREEKAADGTVTNVSKNWLQKRILEATNFKGSPLDVMLNDIPELKEAMGKAEEAAVAATSKPSEVKPEPKQLSKLELMKIEMAKLEAEEKLNAGKTDDSPPFELSEPTETPTLPAATVAAEKASSPSAASAGPAKSTAAAKLASADEALLALGITL